jgi:glycosyltransferase involved in cell wall biosynthesis
VRVKRSDLFVSAVATVHDQGPAVAAFAAEVLAVLREHYAEYELILVDDGSSDETAAVAGTLARQTAGVRLVRLSRCYGGDVARLAGLDAAIGDFVVVLQPGDPPSAIPGMAERYRSGVDVVHGVAEGRPGGVYGAIRAAYRWAWKRVFGRRAPSATATLFGLSRRAVGALTRARPRRRHLTLWLEQIGFRRETFGYQRLPGHAGPGGLFEMIDCGLDLAVSASSSPLRVVSYLGCAAAGLNLLAVGYVAGVNLFKHHVAEGWTTLALQNSLMFFLVFLTLVFLAEYVGRLLEESNDRPLYHVLDEAGGTPVAAETGARNVVADGGLPFGKEKADAA